MSSMPTPTQQVPSSLSRSQTVRGIRLWNLNGALDAVHSAVTTGAFTIGFALNLGASASVIGFIAAAPSLGQMLQAFSPLLIERMRERRLLCMLAAALSYLLWLPIAFLPFFIPNGGQPLALVFFIALSGASMAMALPAQSSWFTDLVPGAIRGRFIARQQSILAGVGLATTLGAGVFMDRFAASEQQQGFTILFVFVVVVSMGAVWVWNRIPEPPRPPVSNAPALTLLALPFRHPAFRKLMGLVSGRLFIAQIVAPFFTVYMLTGLNMSYTEIAIFSALQTLANIVLNPFWGYLSDKFGYKPIFMLCAGGLAFYPFWWVFITPDNYSYLVPLSQIWGGAMSGGIPIAQFNLMIKTAPDTNRSVYIGAYTAVSRLAIVLSAPVGAALATICLALPSLTLLGSSFSNFQYLFFVGFLLRLAWIAMLTRVSDENATPTRQVIDQMRSGNPITTLWHLIRMGRSTDAAERAHAAWELGESGSPLAMDELIKLLGDTDRAVRREAVRSLAKIGDERAAAPLLDSIGDPAFDVAEEAAEALGAIPSPFSLNILVTLLDEERPSVRKGAALALGRIGNHQACEALNRLLSREKDHLVKLATTEALSRIGEESVLPTLQVMLKNSHPGIERKSLSHSISRLLHTSDAFYSLLQTDSLAQDQLIAKLVRVARRRLARWEELTPEKHAQADSLAESTLRAYELEQFTESSQFIHRLVRLLFEEAPHRFDPLNGISTPAGTPPPRDRSRRDFRLALDFLDFLYEESHHRTLLYEEFLLSMVVLEQIEAADAGA